jgi:hypothetical protein
MTIGDEMEILGPLTIVFLGGYHLEVHHHQKESSDIKLDLYILTYLDGPAEVHTRHRPCQRHNHMLQKYQ